MTEKEEKSNKAKEINRKLIIYGSSILFAIIFIAALILYFKPTYEIYSKQLIKIDPPTTVTLTKEAAIAQPVAKPIEITQVVCHDSSRFILAYYQARLSAEQGKDFGAELVEVNKHKIESNEIKAILAELTELSAKNIEDHYFAPTFNGMIRELYLEEKKTSNSLAGYIDEYLRQLFFIRPIENRAIEKGGFDKYITLTQRALSQNELAEAAQYMNEIPSERSFFNEFKLMLQARLKIKADFARIDKLLAVEGK